MLGKPEERSMIRGGTFRIYVMSGKVTILSAAKISFAGSGFKFRLSARSCGKLNRYEITGDEVRIVRFVAGWMKRNAKGNHVKRQD